MEDTSGGEVANTPVESVSSELDEAERLQIAERLCWTPKERLHYLLDMLAFEERARRARPLTCKR
jgi:hypothetical protein